MKFSIITIILLAIFLLIVIVKQTKKKQLKFEPSNSGLSESEIKRLETALNKKLPEYYKNFLKNYPDDLVFLGAPYNTVSELSLPNNTDRLIEINKYEFPPSNILIIGVNGLGDFYYIILDSNPKNIYEFPHDDPPFIDKDNKHIDWKKPEAYSNLNEFILELKDTFNE